MRAKKLRLVTLVVIVGAFSGVFAQQSGFHSDKFRDLLVTNAQIIVIQNVRVIDGIGNVAKADQTIVIRDGTIGHVGAETAIPTGAQVIDGSGLTALPGLVMMHEHLIYQAPLLGALFMPTEHSYPPLLLANGVTTARTAGGSDIFMELYYKDLIDKNEWVGPDLIISFFVAGPSPWFRDLSSLALRTEEEVRNEVKYWSGRGATGVKAFMDLPLDHLSAAIEEAHRAEIKVASHLCVVSVEDAAKAGVDSIEHGLTSYSDFLETPPIDECPSSADRLEALDRIGGTSSTEVKRLINLLIENEVAVTSTLPPTAEWACKRPALSDSEKSVLGTRALADQLDEFESCKNPSSDRRANIEFETRRLMIDQQFALDFYRAGGLLLAGSDNGVAGFSSHWQLELMVDGGFDPIEAIKVATHNGAKYLDQLDEIGTLEVGKRANLMLVRGRPDQDISDVRTVEVVFKDGIGYDSKKLIEAVAGTVGN